MRTALRLLFMQGWRAITMMLMTKRNHRHRLVACVRCVVPGSRSKAGGECEQSPLMMIRSSIHPFTSRAFVLILNHVPRQPLFVRFVGYPFTHQGTNHPPSVSLEFHPVQRFKRRLWMMPSGKREWLRTTTRRIECTPRWIWSCMMN